MIQPTKVPGSKNKHRVMLYALSTCIWCRKTKRLLEKMEVAYDFLDVDLLSGDEETAAMEEVEKYNPQCTFPTMVIDGREVIAGFREAEIRKALG